MNYGEIKTQFSNLLNRRDLTTALRETFLQQGIQRTQRTLRIPAMEQNVKFTIDGTFDGTVGLRIPLDLLEVKLITNSHDYQIRQADVSTVLKYARVTGEPPVVYIRRGLHWLLGPVPALGDVVRVDYYANFFPPLVADADENPLSTLAPDAILYGALSYAADYFNDKRRDGYETRFQQAISDLQFQADRDDLTASSYVSPAYSLDLE